MSHTRATINEEERRGFQFPLLSFYHFCFPQNLLKRKEPPAISSKNRLIHLHHNPILTWKRLNILYCRDKSLSDVYNYSISQLETLLQLTSVQAASLHCYLSDTSPEQIIHAHKSHGIKIITVFCSPYPIRLSQMYDPPWVLYMKGDPGLMHSERALAVVGTRTPTSYGRQAVSSLLPPMIAHDVTIVSGLAKGTDALAHQTALKFGGSTIAVLGSGIQHIYPADNKRLAEEIAASHLLLSEFPPGTPPRKWQFPLRNRIISALADVVFLTEAAERSGSLITAYQALDQGRDVKVLPGSIFSKFSKGTNTLLREGASPVTEPNHLWYEGWPQRGLKDSRIVQNKYQN
ncbi:DNA-processing protein DprA [Alteribacillus sp. HJP-4]|uniref:DNA-processing protein DprA n=1 Tax=Alteribacillus sp. HJP-4 TaxID=2775394 RepID=UPI0035CCD68E